MATINLEIDLLNWQREVIENLYRDFKYYTIVCSRQIGKTALSTILLLNWAADKEDALIYYVAPTYQQVIPVYKKLVNQLEGTGLIDNKNKMEKFIELSNGSQIEFKSANRPENLRGPTLDYLIVDEAAYMDDDVWESVLQPATMVKGKKVVFFSTPRGKNYLYDLYMKGLDQGKEKYQSFQFDYKNSPLISDDEVEEIKKSVPDEIFRQEYLAQFIEDGGNVFKNIGKYKVVNNWEEKPEGGKEYYAGLDLAKQQDWTALTIVDREGKVCFVYRDQGKDWKWILNKVKHYIKKYNCKTLVEVNSMGDPIYENLREELGNRVKPFTTTNKTKRDLIEELILNFEEGKIKIPTDDLFPQMGREMETYTFTYSPSSRKIKYHHREGFHDDCVDSLALANKQRESKSGNANYTFGYV